MKVSSRRVQMWFTLFCVLTAVVSVFIFVGSSRAEGEVVENVELQDEGMDMQYVSSNYSDNIVNPTCLDNYEKWESSTKEKPNAQWSTNFVIPTAFNSNGGIMAIQQFMDINGDGLLDYLYVTNGTSIIDKNIYGTYGHLVVDGVDVTDEKWRGKNSCVYLNNGQGWEPVYKCVIKERFIRKALEGGQWHNYYEPVFYGDCADVS